LESELEADLVGGSQRSKVRKRGRKSKLKSQKSKVKGEEAGEEVKGQKPKVKGEEAGKEVKTQKSKVKGEEEAKEVEGQKSKVKKRGKKSKLKGQKSRSERARERGKEGIADCRLILAWIPESVDSIPGLWKAKLKPEGTCGWRQAVSGGRFSERRFAAQVSFSGKLR
jgi:hypothetical protein